MLLLKKILQLEYLGYYYFSFTSSNEDYSVNAAPLFSTFTLLQSVAPPWEQVHVSYCLHCLVSIEAEQTVPKCCSNGGGKQKPDFYRSVTNGHYSAPLSSCRRRTTLQITLWRGHVSVRIMDKQKNMAD